MSIARWPLESGHAGRAALNRRNEMHDEATGHTPPSALLAEAYDGFRPLADRLAACDRRLTGLCGSDNAALVAKAKRLRRTIRDFTPGVTMIGQVKAGKTTLVNAMTGWPELLPADVNPWTSVVTALHLQPGPERKTGRAAFTFFTEEEWRHLVRQGGRLGELAGRAGAEDEVEKVRAQLERMRAKSRERLGQRFEMLLGQSHEYERFDAALVERYVCLGDDFWDEGDSRDRGRFADLTRAADLWLTEPALPFGLCLRDTPGVNDTFMIREQITINALRGSRLCVMVLSAAQALTSVDLALIRMISTLRARDVVIFVNRIDELTDPARDIPEIRAGIRETLRRHDGPAEAEVVFGSGAWASRVIAGQLDALPADSAEALLRLAEASGEAGNTDASVEALVWRLSGLPALGQAIAARVETGAGARLLHEIEVGIDNLDQGAAVARVVDAASAQAHGPCRMDPETLAKALAEIEQRARTRLAADLQPLHQTLTDRIEAARRTFVARATAALVDHLERYGELTVWNYDPCGLRVLLRAAFQRHVSAASRHGSENMTTVAAELNALYASAFTLDAAAQPALTPPPLPVPDAPVVLGQTIALDLRGSWWMRFWRRRTGYKACANDFARLIREETQPMLHALVNENAHRYEASLETALVAFVEANRRIMLDLAEGRRPAPVATDQRATENAE
jgi:hypothetical protein